MVRAIVVDARFPDFEGGGEARPTYEKPKSDFKSPEVSQGPAIPNLGDEVVSTPSLQPASLLVRISSYFFPKPLTAHVRTEVLENGQVELTPVFSTNGHEVPADLVGPEPNQTILGYGVTLDRTSLHVHKTTQARRTRLSKNKAAEFLEGLERTGIPVRSKDGKSRPRIVRVRPEVTLELRPDDSLAVGTELATEGGIILGKPPGLERVKEDDGWIDIDDNLLKVATTGTWLDNVLLSTNGATLIGDDVPQFLKDIQGHRQTVGHVEKNPLLQGLSVFGDKQEDRARVDGDAESITISPRLTFFGPTAAEHEQTLGDLERYEEAGGFCRVSEGVRPRIDVDLSPVLAVVSSLHPRGLEP